MRLHLECVPCYVRQALEAAKMATDNRKLHEQILRESLIAASEFDTDVIGFVLQSKIKEITDKLLPTTDPYREVKEKYNRMVLRLADILKKMIKNSKDPFEISLRISLAGNVIDFGPDIVLNKKILKEAIEKSLSQNLDNEKVKLLQKNINDAARILFIGDNAGEIVLDKIFIESLPGDKITYAVRGGPALNDATMEDAKMVGMIDSVKVITTGLNMPSAILPFCSTNFLDEYKKADLIISKGQGNYEALCDEDKNIFFLLKIKCPLVAENFKEKYEVGDIIIHSIKHT
ncbi:MAG: ARMT1-like domain-containing protein [Actinomycetota bacterium]|nr:ARMT1-like domain-containing protein [Actinomycetota bacterium]